MLEVILTGIIIGICVSAPVGPIGVLCIQRTLNKGMAHGFFSGLGATFSDLIYAIVTWFFMSVIVSFIDNHRILIQIIGFIIICIFEIHIFKTKPAPLKQSSQPSSKTKYFKDFASAFALCFSNPLIIFLFIGLFAHFNFFAGDKDIITHIVGLCSILIGALMWWSSLTLVVSKLRNKFTTDTIWTINKVMGSILIAICIIGVVLSLMGITI